MPELSDFIEAATTIGATGGAEFIKEDLQNLLYLFRIREKPDMAMSMKHMFAYYESVREKAQNDYDRKIKEST